MNTASLSPSDAQRAGLRQGWDELTAANKFAASLITYLHVQAAVSVLGPDHIALDVRGGVLDSVMRCAAHLPKLFPTGTVHATRNHVHRDYWALSFATARGGNRGAKLSLRWWWRHGEEPPQ
jgi:hypothetical protein